MLARRGRGVGLLCLSPTLRISDRLSGFDLHGEAWPTQGGGSGVGGWHWLGVRFVCGGRLGRIGIFRLWGGLIRWRRMILALRMRRVTHDGSGLGRSTCLVGRFVALTVKMLVVRHVVVQLCGLKMKT